MADAEDAHHTSTHRALTLRDVIGAWVICGAIAAMALASLGAPHAPHASAPLESALTIQRDHAGYGTRCSFSVRLESCAVRPRTMLAARSVTRLASKRF